MGTKTIERACAGAASLSRAPLGMGFGGMLLLRALRAIVSRGADFRSRVAVRGVLFSGRFRGLRVWFLGGFFRRSEV